MWLYLSPSLSLKDHRELCVSLAAWTSASDSSLSTSRQAGKAFSIFLFNPPHNQETRKDSMASSIYCNSVSFRRMLKGSCPWKSWGWGLGISKEMRSGFGEAFVTDNTTDGSKADPGTGWAGRSSLSPGIHQGLAFHHKALLLRLRDKADQMLMLLVCVQCLRTFPIKGRQAFSSENPALSAGLQSVL